MTAAPRQKTRHRGVYFREDARGRRRYIVWYEDADGKGRTETLPVGSLESDALARQAELRGSAARGQRMAPTREPFKAYAERWLEEQKVRLKPKTVEIYEWGLGHANKKLGKLKLHEITVDDIARLVNELRRQGMAEKSIQHVLTVVSQVMSYAKRDRKCADNPVRGLLRHERPRGSERQLRILDSAEIKALLEKTPKGYRTLIATAIFTGMRQGELLALRWSDVDFDAGLIRIREGKTNAAAREIVMMPGLGKRLREHKLASDHSKDEELVFSSKVGTPLQRRNVVRRGLEKGLEDAKLEHARFHDLRHTFASMLIGQGLDVTFVSQQLGHRDPAITLGVYAKLFDPKRRRDEAREKLEAAFGGMV